MKSTIDPGGRYPVEVGSRSKPRHQITPSGHVQKVLELLGHDALPRNRSPTPILILPPMLDSFPPPGQGRDLNFHLIFDNCGFSFVTEACLALLRQPHYLLQPFPGSDDEHHWLRAASAASSALRVVWALRPRRLVPLAPSCSILSVVGELLRKKNEVLVVTEENVPDILCI